MKRNFGNLARERERLRQAFAALMVGAAVLLGLQTALA